MESLKEAMQMMMAPYQVRIVTGIVTSEAPLVISLVEDIKSQYREANLFVPSDKRPLKQGEQFYLLLLNKGKSAYVLDRK